MKKRIVLIGLFALITACNQESPFTMGEGRVGLLNKETPINSLFTVFAADSVAVDTVALEADAVVDPIKIYEKGGAHLLTITPTQDSIQLVKHIRVMDPRYTTSKGIHLGSTFAELKKAYEIDKVTGSLKSVMVTLKGVDEYVTFDREVLPENIRWSLDASIEAFQIPDNAQIKHLMINWGDR
jgi:hypothetical protein